MLLLNLFDLCPDAFSLAQPDMCLMQCRKWCMSSCSLFFVMIDFVNDTVLSFSHLVGLVSVWYIFLVHPTSDMNFRIESSKVFTLARLINPRKQEPCSVMSKYSAYSALFRNILVFCSAVP